MNTSLARWVPIAAVVALFLSGPAIANAYSQTIDLNPGWNIVSTPRVVESHSFSAPETSENFAIFILNANCAAGWSTMADLGQTEFVPLFGYFIDNETTSTQELTLNYKDDVTPADRLFQREFSVPGWYSIGIANPTYADVQFADTTNTGNAANILTSLDDKYAGIVDFTDSDFPADPSSVAVGGTWKVATPNDLFSLSDLRETKGYAVYITDPTALYSGFENTDVVPVLDSLSPTSTQMSGTDFTLTVTGNSFVSSSTVNWNGTPLSTTFVSSTQLSAIIPAANITTAGIFSVTVQNPGGGMSNAKNFSVITAVPAPTLTISKNNGVGTQTIVGGTTSQRIGSYSFTNTATEGVNVNSLSVQANGPYFQNLKVLVGGTQLGTTQGTVSSGTIYAFSGIPFNVPTGQTVNVDVYADTLSSATSAVTPATILTNYSGTGQTSFIAISLTTGSVDGQNLTFAGNPQISIGADSTQPPAGQIVMGSTGNTLAIFRMTETSNVENIKVTDLTVHATTTGKAAFNNITLWNGSTLVDTAGSASSVTGGFNYTFHLGSTVIIPQANSVSLALKGDAATFASNGATDNTTTTFGIATSSAVTALGATSNKSVNISINNANGNPQTVLRSALTVSASALGGSNHTKSTVDDIGTITFSANSAGPVAVNTTTVTLAGSGAVSSTPSLQLIDQNGNDVVVAGEAASTTNSTSKTWSFNPGFQISAGGSYTFKVRVNSILTPAAPNISISLSASIQSNTDVIYTDGLDGLSTQNIALPTSAVPLMINSVTYPVGS